MSQFDGATIEIVKWDKYNPRKELKATSWFRLQNSLFEDPDFFQFDHAELCFWTYLLSQASKKLSGTIRLSVAHAERVGRFSVATIESAIKKLQELQCVHVCNTSTTRARDADDTCATRYVTNERTNETDVTPPPAKPEHVRDTQEACKATWLGTLRHFGQERGLSPAEEQAIWKAIRANGAELVDLALYGARFEVAHDDWNPKDHVDIIRVLLPKDGKPRIQKFAGLGSAKRTAEKARAKREEELQRLRSSDPKDSAADPPRADPEKVRKLLEGTEFGRRMKRGVS